MRPGGLIVLDNTLWFGRVYTKSSREDNSTRVLRRLNAAIYEDERVDVCMLPTADGITICRKR